MSAPAYSVVLPLYNEENNLPVLYERLTAVMRDLGESYEILFINDGSADASADIVRDLNRQDPAVKLVSFSRNFGHQLAVSAGLQYAGGEAVIVMDSDLQDRPEDLPQLVRKYREGFDVVYAIRATRQEIWYKKWAYKTFYWLLQSSSQIYIPLDSGDFSIMSRRVVDLLNQMPERSRFVRGLRAWIGFSQTGVQFDRDARHSGEPKYGLRQLFGLAANGLLSFSVYPLRLATVFGLLVSLFSFFSILIVFYLRLFTTLSIPGFAATATILLFLGGVQLLTLGILGEYIGKIFEEVKRRPLYLVAETLGDLTGPLYPMESRPK